MDDVRPMQPHQHRNADRNVNFIGGLKHVDRIRRAVGDLPPPLPAGDIEHEPGCAGGPATAASVSMVQTNATASGIDDTISPMLIQRMPSPPRPSGICSMAIDWSCGRARRRAAHSNAAMTRHTPTDTASRYQVSGTMW